MFNARGDRNLYGGFSLGRAPKFVVTNQGNSVDVEDGFGLGLTFKYRYRNITPQIKFILVDHTEFVSGFGIGYIF